MSSYTESLSPTHSQLASPSYLDKEKSMGIDADFISKINLSFPLPDLEKVSKQVKDIGGDIEQLESKIEAILAYQYNEYVIAFSNFMDSVRGKIRERLDLMEQNEKEYQKKNDIQIIKTERDFFRKEAVRLNGLCKDMSQRIEDLGFNMKLLNGDLVTMTNKWKESENVNKQLLIELESNIKDMKQIENENCALKEKLREKGRDSNSNRDNKERSTKMNSSSPNIIHYFDSDANNNNKETVLSGNRTVNNNEHMNIQKYTYIIEKLKSDLRKENMRNSKTLSELNKMIKEKNNLEKIFNDCVEEVRKDIFSRKLKETIENNVINKKYPGQSTANNDMLKIPFVSDIKYDKFLSGDKKKIMETFILKEEVTSLIQELIFRQSRTDLENNPLFKGINILNENRISCDNEPLSTKNTFLKGRFTFSSSVGKKTHHSFRGKMFKNYLINKSSTNY